MATVQSAPNAPAGRVQPAPMTKEEKKVIFASSLGTVFEWYDFYLYGSLAAIIAKQFFSGLDPTAGFIFALLAFAAGFLVRPFGALVFGRLGDMIGRKYTFLVTIVIMGTSTFVVGLLPSYGTIGVAAPVILIALRMLQGLALGGEYGGAATYVAEHAPHGRRGGRVVRPLARVAGFRHSVLVSARAHSGARRWQDSQRTGSRRRGTRLSYRRQRVSCLTFRLASPCARTGTAPAQTKFPPPGRRISNRDGWASSSAKITNPSCAAVLP